MPKYRVQTDQGTFVVNVDQPVASQEELMTLAQDAIDNADLIAQTPEEKVRPGRPEGFLATLRAEATGGTSDIATGIKRALSADPLRPVDQPIGLLQAGAGGLRTLFSPVTAAGAKAGELTQDLSMQLGAGLNVSAGLATAADLGTQFLGFPNLMARGIAKIGSKLTPTATAQAISQAGEKFRIPLTAAQITQSRGLSQLESFPSRFPFGVQPMATFGKKQVTASKEASEKIGEQISPTQLSTKEAGELFKETLYPEASKAARDATEIAYNAVKTEIPENALFDTFGLLKSAQEVRREATLSKGFVQSKGERLAADIKSKLSPETDIPAGFEKAPPDVLSQLMQKYNLLHPDKKMTFEGMDFLRKDLREALRTAKQAGKDQEVRRLGILIDGLTDDMRETAKKFPNAFALLEDADKQFAKEVAPFFTKGKFPRKLSEEDASQFVKSYIWGNRDRPERIELVKQAIGKPEEYNKLVRAWWQDMVEKSFERRNPSDPATEVFSIARMITNYGRFSPEVRTALMGNTTKEADQLIGLLSNMKQSAVSGLNPSETARGMLGGLQVLGAVRVVGQALTGNIPAVIKEGIVIMSPMAVAKVVTSPNGIKLLSRQMQLPPKSPEAVKLGAQIAAIANSALSKSEMTDILRTKDIPIEDKINASLGRNALP